MTVHYKGDTYSGSCPHTDPETRLSLRLEPNFFQVDSVDYNDRYTIGLVVGEFVLEHHMP